MAASFFIFLVSALLWIARRSGEHAGRKAALDEIQAATKGTLLDLQTRIKAKQTAIEEEHAKYEDKLPAIWPANGTIELRKLEENKDGSIEPTSADLLYPGD